MTEPGLVTLLVVASSAHRVYVNIGSFFFFFEVNMENFGVCNQQLAMRI